jgi:DnaK suppressor protein
VRVHLQQRSGTNEFVPFPSRSRLDFFRQPLKRALSHFSRRTREMGHPHRAHRISTYPASVVDASQLARLSFLFGPNALGGSLELPQNYRSELMDKKKLEAFKKRLETRQQDLRRTVSRTQADGRSADEDTAQDIADRAASSYTKEFLFSQSNNERQLLQMVEKALARIREGSFGECIHCGKEINAKRLEAVPWTRHCIECQEKLEQGLLEEAPR